MKSTYRNTAFIGKLYRPQFFYTFFKALQKLDMGQEVIKIFNGNRKGHKAFTAELSVPLIISGLGLSSAEPLVEFSSRL